MYFLKTITDGKKLRVQALEGQKFSDGSAIDTKLNVQCDKQKRSNYTEGTVFGCYDLTKARGFYRVPYKDIYCVAKAVGAKKSEKVDAPTSMRTKYEAYLKGEVEVKAKVSKKPTKVAKPKPAPKTELQKLKENPIYTPPTIEGDGFYVDNETWYLAISLMLDKVPPLLVGPTGSGKTELTMYIAQKTKKQIAIHDMGAMHDPMSALLGVHRMKDGNSIFDPAQFTNDVQKGGIILLDELSRAPLATNNILFPCLDSRRTLPVQIAESEHARDISIHPDCVFFATANIGAEYTGTTTIDRALVDRFFPLELDYMDVKTETMVIRKRSKVDNTNAELIAKTCKKIRDLARKGDLSTAVSTRHSIRIGDLIKHGFSTLVSFERVLYPLYEGTKSEGERSVVASVITSL